MNKPALRLRLGILYALGALLAILCIPLLFLFAVLAVLLVSIAAFIPYWIVRWLGLPLPIHGTANGQGWIQIPEAIGYDIGLAVAAWLVYRLAVYVRSWEIKVRRREA